jgi:hypothetical protein
MRAANAVLATAAAATCCNPLLLSWVYAATLDLLWAASGCDLTVLLHLKCSSLRHPGTTDVPPAAAALLMA